MRIDKNQAKRYFCEFAVLLVLSVFFAFFIYPVAMQNLVYHTKSYDLDELISDNSLQLLNYDWSEFIDSNEELNQTAETLSKFDLIGAYIILMEYDYERLDNDSIKPFYATEVFERKKGMCVNKAKLACAMYEAAGTHCYVAESEKYLHSIVIVEDDGVWRPVLTTGYLHYFNIDDFMDNLTYLWDRNSLRVYSIYDYQNLYYG